MADYKFYMTKVTQNDDGSLSTGKKYDIETDFIGLKYKSLTGANAYGKPKGVYAESFVEDAAAQVFVDKNGERAQTDLVLSLYFLDPNKWGGTATGATPYMRASKVFHDFVETFENAYVLWNDTARNRYALLYMEEAPTIQADKLIDLQYIEAQFRFKNVYGRTFTKNPITAIPVKPGSGGGVAPGGGELFPGRV